VCGVIESPKHTPQTIVSLGELTRIPVQSEDCSLAPPQSPIIEFPVEPLEMSIYDWPDGGPTYVVPHYEVIEFGTGTLLFFFDVLDPCIDESVLLNKKLLVRGYAE
jgi:hypothetical protein